MNYKIRDAINLAIARKATELITQLEELVNVLFTDEDIYFEASWSDHIYPGCPHNETRKDTVEECIVWLSQQSHPMGFTGCRMHIGMYVDVLEEPTLIKSYEAEKLAMAHRAGTYYQID
jgi:hypothetical protein